MACESEKYEYDSAFSYLQLLQKDLKSAPPPKKAEIIAQINEQNIIVTQARNAWEKCKEINGGGSGLPNQFIPVDFSIRLRLTDLGINKELVDDIRHFNDYTIQITGKEDKRLFYFPPLKDVKLGDFTADFNPKVGDLYFSSGQIDFGAAVLFRSKNLQNEIAAKFTTESVSSSVYPSKGDRIKDKAFIAVAAGTGELLIKFAYRFSIVASLRADVKQY